MQTLNQCISEAIGRLTPIVGEREARASVRLIFEAVKGWTPVDLAIKGGEPVSPFVSGKVSDVVNRMVNHEPIQYILGEAQWYGMKFKVTPAVLIPRPETAEMVDVIVKDWASRRDLSVADLCTGSGCIAIALSRSLPFAHVDAVDNSQAALDVAGENARNLKADRNVSFINADVLDEASLPDRQYDIIVSNPPYIAEDERGSMDKNVLLFEPDSALFVPDANPLVFYEAILGYAGHALRSGGMIYFEINPNYASRLVEKMEAGGFNDVCLIRDVHGTNRFVKAVKK